MMRKIIPFNKPHLSGKELYNIAQSAFSGRLAGDGGYTELCHQWLEQNTTCKKALLTHSCTAALEMAALLLDIQPGDEIIMPSYTFVSTANAFVLRGGIPVFVDIRADTLNLDEKLIEDAITSKTKAIVPVHYAGVSCEMDLISDIAKKYDLAVVEDAAQGIMSTYKGRPLGSLGDFGALSFHETKNVIAGEGGAILINSSDYIERAEVIREKGTDRSRFFRGEIDKYTWQDIGSSFLPGELIASFLWAQLEDCLDITQSRLNAWNYYHDSLKSLEDSESVRRPIVPDFCTHNAHMYYLVLNSLEQRTEWLHFLKSFGVNAVFHYVPLHLSPAGQRYGRVHGQLNITESLSQRIIRLPIWYGMPKEDQDYIMNLLYEIKS